jgi:mannose-6-phosphate isomerase
MGTHSSLPSKLIDGKLLSDHLASDPAQLLGKQISNQYGSHLPFLFKVLAIGKALSIQAHPDRQLAIKLHKQRPDVYKDDNHKVWYLLGFYSTHPVYQADHDLSTFQPEMAIAITPFSGFCGFRPLNQISQYLEKVPEFATVIGQETSSRFLETIPSDASTPPIISSTSADQTDVKTYQAVLKELFGKLMNASSELVTEQVQKLIKRIEAEGGRDKPFGTDEELLLRLNDQFPDDVGIFCTFVLNVVQLEPGQAAFLQADEPHAYLTGGWLDTFFFIHLSLNLPNLPS